LAPHLGRSLPDHFGAFRGPVLSYHCADDRLAPAAAVDALLRMYAGARVTQRQLDPKTLGLSSLGHFGFFRAENASLWSEAADWIRPTAPPGPTLVGAGCFLRFPCFSPFT
jgi:predicted alpha/beta hydrolase